MMSKTEKPNSTILIVIGLDAPSSALAKKLEAIRAMPAHASILIVNEMPMVPYYAFGVAPYEPADVPMEWHEEVSTKKIALAAKADEVETLLAQHDVSGEVATIACELTAVPDHIARHAMLCDMAWVGEDLRMHGDLFFRVVHGVLFQSPVGVLLNDPDAKFLSITKRVFVAWNTQLQTARAVHQALPILRQAKEVIIGTIDPVKTEWRDGEDPGIDVAKWLTHHGCNVVVSQHPSGGQDIGSCILGLSKGADLIVMGAYGHSRTREAIFGGTTRTLINQTDQAVFLAH